MSVILTNEGRDEETRLECLRLAKGDIGHAHALYAWVVGWAPTHVNEMLRSRAPAPAHSAAETSAPRQPWMTDEQARRYGDGA